MGLKMEKSLYKVKTKEKKILTTIDVILVIDWDEIRKNLLTYLLWKMLSFFFFFWVYVGLLLKNLNHVCDSFLGGDNGQIFEH